MRLYHTTTVENANSIMREGFRDNATKNTRLTRTISYPPGVFFGDTPVLDDELFDGVGLFDFDAERQIFIAVKTRGIAGIETIVDSTWTGTQYWGKAEIWNKLPRQLLSLNEAIKIRLNMMTQQEIRNLKRFIREERDYNVEFVKRVKGFI